MPSRGGRRPGLLQRIVAVVLIAQLALAATLVVELWPHPEAPVVPPEDPELLVLRDGQPVLLHQVDGSVQIFLENPPEGGARILVVASNGDRVVLTAGAAEAMWDTTAWTNGPYELVAEADGDVIARTPVTLQNARADAATTAAVVGTTTAVAAGGSAVGSSLASRAALAAAQIGKESLMAVGEDHLALRTAARKRMASRWALGITLLLVFLFFPFEGLSAYLPSEYVAAIPIAGGVSVIFVAAALGSEYLLGIMSRATTQVRFLASGAVSLALSSIIFRTPFGYPGYIEEVDDEDHDGIDDEPPHVEGIRAVATLTFLLTLLLPFLWVGYRWNYAIVDQAMEIALVGIATSALPVRPLPGYDIWVWRRSIAILYAIGAFVLYFGFMLAFLPSLLLLPLGIFGLLFYVGTLVWLRARSAEPQPAWYRRSVADVYAIRASMVSLAPNLVASVGRGNHRLSAAAARRVDQGVAAITRIAQAAVTPITNLMARAQDRRMARLAEAMDDAYLDEIAEGLLAELEGLDDDAMFTLIGPDGMPRSHEVGDLRDRSYRNSLLRAWEGKPPSTVTVVDGDHIRAVDLDPKR